MTVRAVRIGHPLRIDGVLDETVGYRGRLELSSQLSVEPTVAVNWVDLPEGQFTARLFGERTTFTFFPTISGSPIQAHGSRSAGKPTRRTRAPNRGSARKGSKTECNLSQIMKLDRSK